MRTGHRGRYPRPLGLGWVAHFPSRSPRDMLKRTSTRKLSHAKKQAEPPFGSSAIVILGTGDRSEDEDPELCGAGFRRLCLSRSETNGCQILPAMPCAQPAPTRHRPPETQSKYPRTKRLPPSGWFPRTTGWRHCGAGPRPCFPGSGGQISCQVSNRPRSNRAGRGRCLAPNRSPFSLGEKGIRGMRAKCETRAWGPGKVPGTVSWRHRLLAVPSPAISDPRPGPWGPPARR